MNFNEILNVSNKSVLNLRNIVEELNSYKCDVDIDIDGKVKVRFAFLAKDFTELIEQNNLDFNSELNGANSCRLFVCLGKVEFFTLIYFKTDDEDECFREKNKENLKIIEDFLRL